MASRRVAAIKEQKRCLHLQEYQSHQLLKDFGIDVPRGQVASTPKEVRDIVDRFGGKCVIKSQILKGGRGKGSFDNGLSGGIQTVDTSSAAEKLASKMLGHRLKTKQTSGNGITVDKVYVAEAIQHTEEWYLSLTLDRENYTPVILISRNGGINIENTAKSEPGSVKSFPFSLAKGITSDIVARIAEGVGASPGEADKLGDVLTRLYKLFVSKDATMLEINPLAQMADGSFKSLDTKFTFDDASEKRQPELFALRDTKAEVGVELEAQKYGLIYIKLNGSIGNVVNGAGLAMATNDAIAHHGGASANFLDAGGQATKETMKKAIEIILRDKSVKVILVNIYGGIIKCDMIAESIISAAQDLGQLNLPVVVRLQGTNSAEGLKLLEKANLGFHVESGFGEAAKKAVELAKLAK